MSKAPQTKLLFCVMAAYFYLALSNKCFSQRTNIRGYASAAVSYSADSLDFNLGEQVLFITSQINDRMSFLAESVFKFSTFSPTSFDVSIERIIMKYNFRGNHSILVGKVHTPVSYWNYTYHHGVVFSPTINRPLFFAAGIIPLHTTGAGLQATNLGAHKLGYDVFVGNGIGSSDLKDNDNRKSVTASVHFRPVLNFKEFTVGAHYYNDVIDKGAKIHDGAINQYRTKQQIATISLVYLSDKFEAIAERMIQRNRTDTTGAKRINAGYLYAGMRVKDKLVPYIKADFITYQNGQVYQPSGHDVLSLIAGVRYEISYLSVLKLELEHADGRHSGKSGGIGLQWSVGF